jgi:glycine cleavage system transcriptional repressor
MQKYILSITATDRPGIVAGLSEAIVELKGNIEAASQTVHQGYFAMIILAGFEEGLSTDDLVERMRRKAGEDLHVYITPHNPNPAADEQNGQSFIVTSVGQDKPGILHALTTYLASKSINIDDLYCYVEHDEFVVICQVKVPSELDVFMLQADLEAVGQAGGFVAGMQHENIFVATNELRLGTIR